jgi:DNA repair protein RecN (Recombination protein N)
VLMEISVENVALIEEATLELSPGLNAITGETGAGKTLLATALQMLLGGRARSEVVRAGARRATVEGTFDLPDETCPSVLEEALGDLAEEVEAEDGVVMRRTLTADGRSRCYVGGVTVSVRALASLGKRIVSYHGQREQTRLAEPAEQLAILDDFLDEDDVRAREERETLWRAVERDRRKLEEITASSEARLREIDFLRFQVSELEAAGYSAQELADLSRERDRLRNVTDLLQSTVAAARVLSPEEGGGAIDAVADAVSELERASRYDEGLSGLLGSRRSSRTCSTSSGPTWTSSRQIPAAWTRWRNASRPYVPLSASTVTSRGIWKTLGDDSGAWRIWTRRRQG